MNTLEKVNIAILLATITYIIANNSLLVGTDQIAPALRWFITFLTSVGLFRLLIILVYWTIRISDTLLAMYHQGRFLQGIWTYRYEVDGVPHMGLWRITQDLSSIAITGYGIDARGRIDSHFRSISQLFEHQGVEEIMFARTDTASGEEHFAKTTLYIDRPSRPSWRSGPTFMRAQSVLYGHDEDGIRHADIILRRARPGISEARIVEEMGCADVAKGTALPDATVGRMPEGGNCRQTVLPGTAMVGHGPAIGHETNGPLISNRD